MSPSKDCLNAERVDILGSRNRRGIPHVEGGALSTHTTQEKHASLRESDRGIRGKYERWWIGDSGKSVMFLWAGRRIGTLVLDFGSTRSLSLARFDHLIELHLGASWDELEPGQGVAGTCKPSIVLPLLELT